MYTLSLSLVFEWHKAFSECRKDIENLAPANRQFNERVKEKVLESRRVQKWAKIEKPKLAEGTESYPGLCIENKCIEN